MSIRVSIIVPVYNAESICVSALRVCWDRHSLISN